ncbi:juvenile hormone esterase [Leptinotarsa decemlineata]|uniref:juvenile hormone esterase n=1 Tax=Leptinotarsa decemlineata TaxID=7539 RepID=UPI003D30B451
MKLTSVLFLTVHFIFVVADILVTIPDGTIRGREEYSQRGIKFFSFQQIPFAKPPLGELRFKEPQPVDKWEGVLNATTNTKVCYQTYGDDRTVGLENEDCLYLNVFTPRYPSSTNSLPVMFEIYGGGFMNGAATLDTFGPHYLMENDVIVVSVNYRVAAFGFLSTGDMVIPGNYGLKDQQMGLKWVQKNIKYFGGDPKKVTIFGESAGASSVAYQLLSKGSQGLFRAAIAASGTALSPWAYQRDHKEYAYKLASGIDENFKANSTSEDLLNFLRSVPASKIKDVTRIFPEDLHNDQITEGFFFAPVVEPAHENAFLTEKMYSAIENGRANRVPLMIGMCEEELLIKANDPSFSQYLKLIDEDQSILVNKNMRLTDEKDITNAANAIHSLYTNGRFEDHPGAAIRFFSDSGFSKGIIRHAQLQSKFSEVYFYQFNYHGRLSGNTGPFFEGAGKIRHGEDLTYIWAWDNQTYLNSFPQEDVLTNERIRQLYTDFAKHLNPTPSESELLENIIWPKVKPDDFQYLDFNNTLTIKSNPKADVYSKWLDIYEKMVVKPYDTF